MSATSSHGYDPLVPRGTHPSRKRPPQFDSPSICRPPRASVNKYPDNAELALLSGLVASYAFNLDVKDSGNIAPAALSAATKLDSSDLRAQWFLAAHNCQTSKLLKEGMSAMLDVQASSRNDLPSSFWFDYMTCATLTDMPAHAAEASLHLSPTDLADPVAHAVIDKMSGACLAHSGLQARGPLVVGTRHRWNSIS